MNTDIGHIGGNAAARLKSFVERIENLEEEKKATSEDIKDVYTELKSVGYDAKIVKKLIKRRAMDPEKRNEEDELLDLYEVSLEGMLS